MRLSLLAFAAFAGAALAPALAVAQNAVLVERVAEVAVTRGADGVLVTANGIVPIAGFSNPVLRPRPDLVKVEGGYVLDFMATPPPRDAFVAQIETRITVTYRIGAPGADAIRFVQVRAAVGSRTVQIPAAR